MGFLVLSLEPIKIVHGIDFIPSKDLVELNPDWVQIIRHRFSFQLKVKF